MRRDFDPGDRVEASVKKLFNPRILRKELCMKIKELIIPEAEYIILNFI